jgi:hypothetical protein
MRAGQFIAWFREIRAEETACGFAMKNEKMIIGIRQWTN